MGRRIVDLAASEQAEICQLYRAGDPIEDIARAYGLSGGTVSKVAITLGGCKPRNLRIVREASATDFDPDLLRVEDVDGASVVSHVSIGEMVGLRRPRELRRLIERNRALLEKSGLVRCRNASIVSGKGRVQDTIEYLLNRDQAILVIQKSTGPRADEITAHVVRVFGMVQDGKLVPADYAAAVELQTSREQVADAVPGFDALSEGFQQSVEAAAARGAREAVLKFLEESGIGNSQVGRNDPSAADKRLIILTASERFAGICPCCGLRRVIDENGNVIGDLDHWTDDPRKNAAHQMWLISSECNQAFRTKKKLRHDYQSAFNEFQRRLSEMRLPLLSRL